MLLITVDEKKLRQARSSHRVFLCRLEERLERLIEKHRITRRHLAAGLARLTRLRAAAHICRLSVLTRLRAQPLSLTHIGRLYSSHGLLAKGFNRVSCIGCLRALAEQGFISNIIKRNETKGHSLSVAKVRACSCSFSEVAEGHHMRCKWRL